MKNKKIFFVNRLFKQGGINRGGFTLIEILIVIAIVGVLAAFILVSLTVSRQRSRNSDAYARIKSAHSYAESCYLTGGTVRKVTNAQGANPGTVICSSGSETYPDLTGTDWEYVPAGSYASTATAGYSIGAINISTGEHILCANNRNVTSALWPDFPWDARRTSGCKKDF